MGTTMVIALVQDRKYAIAHVGDSRIYRVTQQRGLEKLTKDHEVGQREILRGVEPQIAYARPDAYQLTQALGPRNDNFVKPEIQFFEIEEDCILLLCSDGLSDHDLIEKFWDTKIAPLIDANTNLEEGLVNLIDFANHYNGHDNITGVVVRVNLRPGTES
jgi:protein phosphatase